MSDLLDRVALDISRAINYVPRLSPHLAWRLNPEDYEELKFQMSQRMNQTGEEPVIPTHGVFVMGVRVIEDKMCPPFEVTADNQPREQT